MKVSELIEALSKMNGDDIVMVPAVGSSLFGALNKKSIEEKDGKVWINPSVYDYSREHLEMDEDAFDMEMYDIGFATN